MAEVSPLHRVIDSGRWDAERLLGRLIILVHATFLDAGFVPHDAHSVPTKVRPGSEAGGRDGLDPVPPLRRAAPAGRSRRAEDARSAAPLLSCGLDDTARALADDGALLASLWMELTEKLSSRALAGLCRENGLASLPHDVLLAILERLADRKDRLMVGRALVPS
ncbi:hypothetical protein ACQ4PT_033262 [Festuca glaucescens]